MDNFYCSECQECQRILKAKINALKAFLSNFQWLSKAYVSDYFTTELWTTVPVRWWETITALSPPELASLLHLDTWNSSKVWPLSLLAFRASATMLSLDQNLVKLSGADIAKFTGKCPRHVEPDMYENSNDEPATVGKVESGRIKDGQLDLLAHCYRRHVKPKKQHEILQLSEVISEVAECQNCQNIVDVGAGQGHLSRILSYGYGLKVTTVEASSCHAPKAQKFDEETERDIKKGSIRKKLKMNERNQSNDQQEMAKNIEKPKHVTGFIDSNISAVDFLQQVQLSRMNSALEESSEPIPECANNKTAICDESDSERLASEMKHSMDAPEDGFRFLITGLHACGDLTPTMLRVFVKCPSSRGLVSVPCCYMKLTQDCDTDNPNKVGYPMSDFLRNKPDHNLSWEAREMACHFVKQYHKRLLENPVSLRSHVYRAALQEIIRDKNPNIEHGSIKLTLKKAHELPFPQYAVKALGRLNLDSDLNESQLDRAEQRLSTWNHVVAFYTLRLVLAPVIETLILLDRVLYLHEQGINSALVPLFDPELSPRNTVLIAIKSSKYDN